VSWKDRFPKENIYFETENGILYCGDCLEIMPKLPDKSIDLIVSDYPFNCQDGKNYKEFVKETAELFNRKINDIGNLVIINNPANIFITTPFYQDWTLINGVALIRKSSIRPAYHFGFQHNYMLILNKGGIKNKWNGTKINHDKNFPTDVIYYQNGYRGKEGIHPQAIPIDIAETLIKYLSDENDVVLDPFLGSGTTAVACERLNRRWIGIEISKEYCEIAKERLMKWKGQRRLDITEII